MKAIQYRPTYFEGFAKEEVEFSTVKELLEVLFISKRMP
jgi:hypothetical protein